MIHFSNIINSKKKKKKKRTKVLILCIVSHSDPKIRKQKGEEEKKSNAE